MIKPGARFGPYELLEPIGEGGMGVVFKARDRILDRFVAVKVAHPNASRLPLELVEEARAAAALQHPHIVPVYHAGKKEGFLFFAMQYIEGESLDRVVAQSPPSLDQIATWMLQIAEALHFAHVRGLVHYDVKPGNIMIDSFGRAVLLDFGLAKVYKEMQNGRQGTVVASPEFASPEQLLQQPSDERSDIYSLGAVFYFLVTGRLPCQGGSVVAIVKAKLKEDPPPVGSLTPQVANEIGSLIDRMVKREKVERPPSMGEVVQVLTSYLSRGDAQAPSGVLRITQKIKRLPPFPQVGFTLMKEMSRENTNAERLQRIISADSVLVARILRVVNSAYFSIPNRVSTIKHAVSLLGLRQIRDLAFGIYLLELGRGFKGAAGHPLQLRYWSHSVATAFLSEALARYLCLPTVGPGEAYVAGLLHDIGLLILSRYEIRSMTRVVEEQAARRIRCVDLEKELVGATHTELAEWLAGKWSLPDRLRDVAVHHHTARPESPILELENVVRLADAIATRNGYGFYLADDGWELEPSLHRMLALRTTRLPERDLLPFLERVLSDILQHLHGYMAAFAGKPAEGPCREREPAVPVPSPVYGGEPSREPKAGLFAGVRRWLGSS